MPNLDYGIFDCDTHCYETRDAFTRYLPARTASGLSPRCGQVMTGRWILAGHRIATFNSEQGSFDRAYRPGSLKEMLRQMASGHPDETYEAEPMRPEYLERAPRLDVLQTQGVERCVVFPAGMALSAEHYVADTDALYANLESFNRWFDDTWGFNYCDRLYATALLSLRCLDRSVALTDRIIEMGAKVVLIPTGPAYGRSPGDRSIRSWTVCRGRDADHRHPSPRPTKRSRSVGGSISIGPTGAEFPCPCSASTTGWNHDELSQPNERSRGHRRRRHHGISPDQHASDPGQLRGRSGGHGPRPMRSVVARGGRSVRILAGGSGRAVHARDSRDHMVRQPDYPNRKPSGGGSKRRVQRTV